MTAYPEAAALSGAAESVWEGSTAAVTIRIEVSDFLNQAMTRFREGPLEYVFVTDSDIRHIKKKHGANEESRGQKCIYPRDFALLPVVLNEFDSIEHVDTDKLGNKKYLLEKQIEDKLYVVAIQRGKKKLEVKTMWKK